MTILEGSDRKRLCTITSDSEDAVLCLNANLAGFLGLNRMDEPGYCTRYCVLTTGKMTYPKPDQSSLRPAQQILSISEELLAPYATPQLQRHQLSAARH